MVIKLVTFTIKENYLFNIGFEKVRYDQPINYIYQHEYIRKTQYISEKDLMRISIRKLKNIYN
jgi:hypothetical protein